MNTYKDDHYRNMCEHPTDYDKVVDWIAENNPAAKRCAAADHMGLYGSPEEFAAECVHSCIRSVVFSDHGNMWSATGMALALRACSNPDLTSYKKVRLAIQL